MASSSGVLPLCHPNNFRFNKRDNELNQIPGKSRDTIQLVPDALELLRNIKERIGVICICGPARSGKSYMLSQLQDGVEFELGNTMTSKTTGIWISTVPTMITGNDGKEIRLILLDTEGIGAGSSLDGQANEKWDNQIFTLSTLISSLVIYNSCNVPDANDLDKLNFISKLSESVYSQMDGGNSNSQELSNFRNYSPDFFWLLRDVLLKPTDRNGRKCDIKTYLDEMILRPDEDDGTSEVKTRRNAVRKNIVNVFPTFDAYGLPLPSIDEDVVQNMNDPRYRNDISKKFISEMEIVKQKILCLVKPKRMTGASYLTGATFVELLKMYVKALNEKGCVPDWSTSWENAVKITCEGALAAAIAEYQKNIAFILEKLPCSTDYMNSAHSSALNRASALFSEETKMSTDTAVTSEYITKLMNTSAEFDNERNCIGGLLLKMVKQNEQASEMFCTNLYRELRRKHVDPILDNLSANTRYEDLIKAIAVVTRRYAEQAIGPRAGSVEQRFVGELQERLNQAKSEIQKLKDYDEKLNKEMEQAIKRKAELDLLAQRNVILNDNIETSDQQHKQQISMMTEQQKRSEEEMGRIKQQQREDKERLEGKIDNLSTSHKEEVKSLIAAQEEKLEQLARENESQRAKQETESRQQRENQEVAEKRQRQRDQKLAQQQDKAKKESPGFWERVSSVPIIGPVVRFFRGLFS